MGKYFGTDGIRGVANLELDSPLAYRTGVALARLLTQEGEKPLVCIGRDTRISGPMLEAALTAGLCAGGADVTSLGVIPTPAVALLTATGSARAGIVISASHNPFGDNGIKIFGEHGYKLTDAQEAEIEAAIDAPLPPLPTGGALGRVIPFEGDAAALYAAHLVASGSAAPLRVLFDCANGAACTTAKHIFPALGVDAVWMADQPDGVNINAQCGSTHMDALCRRVAEEGFDLGVAFDGDADRCLICDEQGQLVDGDRILGILADTMQKAGALKGGVVATIISNLGLHTFLQERGIGISTTAVGDRYVLERMRENGWNLGGEQSGHVILTDAGTTGDGQLTAVRFLAALCQAGVPASTLAHQIELYPQAQVNITVPGALKHQIAGMHSVQAAQEEIQALFGSQGRIVVRPSGTEPKVRVMVEGRDEAIVQKMAQQAADAIRAEVERL